MRPLPLRLWAFLLLTSPLSLWAATPPSGTLTDTSGPLNYTAGPFNVANPTPPPQSGIALSGPICTNPAQPCDDFALTVIIPAGYAAINPNAAVKVTASWTDGGTGQSDYDLYIYNGTVTSTNGLQGADYQSASSSNPEVARIRPVNDGTVKFTVKLVPFKPTGETLKVKIELLAGDPPFPPVAYPPPPPDTPIYFNYASPSDTGSAGEPSLGINYKSEKIFSNSNGPIPNGGTSMYYGGFLPYALKITFDDCPSPANATWDKKTLLTAGAPRALGDPILFTDHTTGRTFVSQLVGGSPAGSTTDITDNDGDSFLPSQGSSLPSDIDHQTVGGGPFHAPLTGTPAYPNAVYYASQSVAEARATLSVDGGFTFGPSTLMYTTADCKGLHGHIKVAPDGTVYVPNNACGGTDLVFHVDGMQGVIVSEDNGTTWTIRKILGSTTKSAHDSSVGVATDSKTIYEGMQSADGHPRISVSHDKGVKWSTPFDVGASVINGRPVLNTAFPAVVAGDPDRAAFAFYGTETGGTDYRTVGFPGVWYLYIATTLDGGLTWTTQNVTPGDPIQRGPICGSGTCRNLLDFFDASIDKEGRVLVGWDDGCIGACVQGPPNSFSSKPTITRQSGGKRMMAAFDPVEPALPGAPNVLSAVRGPFDVLVSWLEPGTGGSPITGHKIYRGTTSGGETFLANVLPAGTATEYHDSTAPATGSVFYRVTAVNAIGEGPFCREVSLLAVPPVETSCTSPGITILKDPAGDNTPAVPGTDLLSFQLSQPLAADNVVKLVFTINTDAGQSPQPASSAWYVVMQIPDPAPATTAHYRAVHMVWNGATPTFESYTPSTNTAGGTDGRFVTAGTEKPAEASSSYAAPFKKVVIVVKASDLGLSPGDTITGFLSGSSQTAGRATALYDQMLDSLTFTGTYIVTDNLVCRPNAAPIAVLTATPASGAAPLTVNFSGVGSSDPDAGDTIASYYFSFGDGSAPVTQASPTISHIYSTPGTYTAFLGVTDSRGKTSATTSTQTITVSAPSQGLVVSSASPGPLCQSAPDFMITVNGSGFVSGSVVQINGSNRRTTFVSTTQLTATALLSDVDSSRRFTVRVVNPDGSLSNAVSVSVPLVGDLNLDGRVDSTDLVIMANYLVGNMTPGTAPFNAPLSAADLNRDSKVDAVDFVILANYLAANIACLPTN